MAGQCAMASVSTVGTILAPAAGLEFFRSRQVRRESFKSEQYWMFGGIA